MTADSHSRHIVGESLHVAQLETRRFSHSPLSLHRLPLFSIIHMLCSQQTGTEKGNKAISNQAASRKTSIFSPPSPTLPTRHMHHHYHLTSRKSTSPSTTCHKLPTNFSSSPPSLTPLWDRVLRRRRHSISFCVGKPRASLSSRNLRPCYARCLIYPLCVVNSFHPRAPPLVRWRPPLATVEYILACLLCWSVKRFSVEREKSDPGATAEREMSVFRDGGEVALTRQRAIS